MRLFDKKLCIYMPGQHQTVKNSKNKIKIHTFTKYKYINNHNAPYLWVLGMGVWGFLWWYCCHLTNSKCAIKLIHLGYEVNMVEVLGIDSSRLLSNVLYINSHRLQIKCFHCQIVCYLVPITNAYNTYKLHYFVIYGIINGPSINMAKNNYNFLTWKSNIVQLSRSLWRPFCM